MEGIREGARVEVNAEKRNPADFALWKFCAPGEKRQMEWAAPWGVGFPGWHLECSAMAMKHLGETIDIHCGGEDHVAVHHSNEIAQSEAATGKPFSKFWMHARFLIMGDSGKMSKSAGGFITTSSLQEKGYEPLAFRYFCFSAHYRKQLEFSWESIDTSAKNLEGLRGIVAKLKEESLDPKANKGKDDRFPEFYGHFKEALADDLNMPQALAVLWGALRSPYGAAEKLSFVLDADKVLGLDLGRAPKPESLPPELAALITEREAARKVKDFKRSDELRKTLSDKGVSIEDTPKGTTWKLVRG